MQIDIREMPVVLECISAELSNGNAVEVKMERDYITVVRLDRRLMLRLQADEREKSEQGHIAATKCD